MILPRTGSLSCSGRASAIVWAWAPQRANDGRLDAQKVISICYSANSRRDYLSTSTRVLVLGVLSNLDGLRHIQSTFGTESTLVLNSTDNRSIDDVLVVRLYSYVRHVISICYWANSRRDYFSTSTKDAWPWIDCDTNRNGKYGIRHMSDLCLCEMFLFRKLRKRFFSFRSFSREN